HQHRRALPNLVEEGGLGPRGDISGHFEGAEGTAALDVIHAIGDALAHEVGQFLEQVGVLQQIGPGRAKRERVLITGNWAAGVRGRVSRLVTHFLLFSFKSSEMRYGCEENICADFSSLGPGLEQATTASACRAAR